MIERLIIDNHRNYPLMRIEDFIKLLYQGEYGCAHACHSSMSEIRQSIIDEAMTIEPTAKQIDEQISASQVRINLANFFAQNMSVDTLVDIFAKSAINSNGAVENLKRKLDIFDKLVADKSIGLPYNSVKSAIIKYLNNIRPLSHSVTYKLNYKPHYRVVKKDYFTLFDIITLLNTMLKKHTLIIAIDGDSGSGKSYYSKILEEYYSPICNVFHADDFFLPPQLRTQERLNEIGGNIHYERLNKVIDTVKSSKMVEYEKYDCHTNSYTKVIAPVRQLNIVEGVYSTHPSILDKYDMVIYFKISPIKQQQHILQRNGIAILQKYNDIWLPMERKFFNSLKSSTNSIVIDTTNFDTNSKDF